MELKEYFESNEGSGVLATADKDGKVGIAVYARPHILEDGTAAFIMPDRLTHENLQSNPHAAYLFTEKVGSGGKKYCGIRLFLSKIKEEKDSKLLFSLSKRPCPEDQEGRYLVVFQVDKVLPLIGAGEDES